MMSAISQNNALNMKLEQKKNRQSQGMGKNTTKTNLQK